MKLGAKRRFAFVRCFDVTEEHGKRDSVVEGMVKDNDKVVFARGRGYVAKVDRGSVICILSVKVKTMNEILRRVIDGLPLLGSPLEVRGGMYDLSPTTNFCGKVE